MKARDLAPGDVLPLVRSLEGCPDPAALYGALTANGSRAETLMLESGDTSTQLGEKSLVVTRCALWIRIRGRTVEIEARTPGGNDLLPWLAEVLTPDATVEHSGGLLRAVYPPTPPGDDETRLRAPSPADALRAVAHRTRVVGGGPAEAPLVVGALAYDLLGAYEDLPGEQLDLVGWADAEIGLPDRMVWLDQRHRRCKVIAHVFGGEHAGEEAGAAEGDIAHIADVVSSLADGSPAATAQPAGGGEPGGETEPTVDADDATFAALVARLQEHIRVGDVFQIVPSRTFSVPCSDPFAAYLRLRDLNPSPYMFFVHGPDGVLFGSSPETAVKVDGQPREVEIRPIAGTRPRARAADGAIDHDRDVRIEAELRSDPKEVAEHMMLVDLARNDVARVSVPGTRAAQRLLGVDRYSHVMHLVSHVRGQLRPDLDALHAYIATMNMGTLVGAPKLRAAALLREVEQTRRGPYGGAVGYLTHDGRLDTCVVIRSAVVRDGVAHVRAGAGVVADSVPQLEADETRRKAGAVLQAVQEAARPGPTRPARHHGETPAGVLFIDNLDSFTFNLVDELRAHGAQVEVWRNDLDADEALARALELPAPRLIMLSPGPGAPADAGCCVPLVRAAAGVVPLFGVCLGHQAIVEAFGGRVAGTGRVVHGKSALVEHAGEGIFEGLPSPLAAGRYHSLAATEVPDELVVTARCGDVVMAVQHRRFPIAGVQFHPESILTPLGGALLRRVMAWAARGELSRGAEETPDHA